MLADALSKGALGTVRRFSAEFQWQLAPTPATVPRPILRWLRNPVADDDLGQKILFDISRSVSALGFPLRVRVDLATCANFGALFHFHTYIIYSRFFFIYIDFPLFCFFRVFISFRFFSRLFPVFRTRVWDSGVAGCGY